MPVQTKRKTTVKKETVSAKYERLRLRHWVLFWALVAATNALVILIFSNVDVRTLLPVNIAYDEQQQAEEQLVFVLREQVKSLEQAVNSIEQKASSSTSIVNCSYDKSPANSYVTYVDKTKSVSVSIPYNPAWSSEECQLAPVKPYELGIEFGPGDPGVRDSRLEILPTTSTASILSTIRAREAEEKASGMDTISNIRQRFVSGLNVISYSVDAAIGSVQNHWIAVGRSYVYKIQSMGWLTDAEAIKIIQSLRVTK